MKGRILCISVYFVMNPHLLLKLSMLISLAIVNFKSTIQFNYVCCSKFEVSFTLCIN